MVDSVSCRGLCKGAECGVCKPARVFRSRKATFGISHGVTSCCSVAAGLVMEHVDKAYE